MFETVIPAWELIFLQSYWLQIMQVRLHEQVSDILLALNQVLSRQNIIE